MRKWKSKNKNSGREKRTRIDWNMVLGLARPGRGHAGRATQWRSRYPLLFMNTTDASGRKVPNASFVMSAKTLLESSFLDGKARDELRGNLVLSKARDFTTIYLNFQCRFMDDEATNFHQLNEQQ